MEGMAERAHVTNTSIVEPRAASHRGCCSCQRNVFSAADLSWGVRRLAALPADRHRAGEFYPRLLLLPLWPGDGRLSRIRFQLGHGTVAAREAFIWCRSSLMRFPMGATGASDIRRG